MSPVADDVEVDELNEVSVEFIGGADDGGGDG